MGRAVLGAVLDADDLRALGAVTEPNDQLLGRDAGELVGAARAGRATNRRRCGTD